MIFKQWQQVLDGTKTQTRRPAKWEEDKEYTWVAPTPTGSRITEVVGINNAGDHKLKWAVGKTYAVQPGRGKKSVGRIRITKIRRERLGEINHRDTIAEGIERFVNYPGDWRHQGFACPMCAYSSRDWTRTFAHLWNHVYDNGAWERMKDDDVWVLELERCEE